MKTTIPIYKEELEKVFRYDADSNVLERKWKSGECRAVNSSVENGDGYVRVGFNGRTIHVHRIIYTIFHGNIPKDMTIDHIDNVKTNNNINNLQLLSHRDNVAKSRLGLSPSFNKGNQSFQVQENIRFSGKRHNFHFKYFKSKTEADKFCNAYNSQFGYGKPQYSARTRTQEHWRACMINFKNFYFNTQEKYA